MNIKQIFYDYLGEPYSEEKIVEYIKLCLEEYLGEEYSENHHILPKSIFSDIPNSPLVRLKYDNHILVHQVLVEAYPISSFVLPLYFMENKMMANTKILSEMRTREWERIKTDPKKIKEIKESRKRYMDKYWGSERGLIRKKEQSMELRTKYNDPEYYEKFKKTMTEVNKDPKKRLMAGEAIKRRWADPEWRDKMMKGRKNGKKGNNSLSLKQKWANPEWRAYMLECRKNKNKRKNDEAN